MDKFIKVFCINDDYDHYSKSKVYNGKVYLAYLYKDGRSLGIRDENMNWVGIFGKENFLTQSEYRNSVIDKIIYD